jgi:transcriptional regulator of acetoin/glycerol metabolism
VHSPTIRHFLSRPDPVESPGDCLSDKKAELERAEIVETIMRCCGNREEAAKELGISKATLYRRIRQYNLEL